MKKQEHLVFSFFLQKWRNLFYFPKLEIKHFLLLCTLLFGLGTENGWANPLNSFEVVWQDPITVRGNITDAQGMPLSGASVQEKNTNNGAVADFDGNYVIEVSSSNAVLVFSYLGMQTAERTVGLNTSINVQLEEDANFLDEVVVVGYGTTAKKDVTGAISSIKGDDFKNLPVSGVDEALQGRMAGVQVVPNGGAPGGSVSLRIRGTGTVNNSEPLYVIDGIPTPNINGVNPNDIESIQVLKDASASAIYGTRAANGVIIVTTVKGKSGEKLNMNVDV
jgi:TonB-dependent SusC/RagA subfamily outer membrane receptor